VTQANCYKLSPVKAKRRDVENLISALQTVLRSTERAQRQGDASRLRILSVIASHPNNTPKAISEEIGVHASSITRQVQALEKDGFLIVIPDSTDRRSCRITLAAPGQAELDRLREIGLQRWSSFVSEWEMDEVQTLTHLLEKLEQSKQAAGPRPVAHPVAWRERRRG
jgi:DNA-binding MarR family transcriptional regulator